MPALASPAEQASLPHRLEGETSLEGEPLWIAASEIFQPGGEIRWEVMGERSRRHLENALDLAATRGRATSPQPGKSAVRCDFSIRRTDAPGPPANLSDLLDEALVVISGTVTASREGFFGGAPATLLQWEPRAAIRDPRAISGAEPLILFRSATLATPRGSYCFEIAGFLEPPRPGDRLVAFIEAPPRDRQGRVLEPQPYAVFIQRSGSAVLEVPAGLRSAPEFATLTNLDALQQWIEAP